ncbi:MAG: GntR family transcriptional regulator [Anaerolineales bacterium]|nr:MAG: GntR family transcriptional regulator [Anaerolineales bacterium]
MTDDLLSAIDRDSYEPAYAQLVRILTRQIAAGLFRPGDLLPSEAQLCDRYGVSPMTVRRVINILADQGVVIAKQGRGTFVKPLELGTATFDLGTLLQLLKEESNSKVKFLEARITPATKRTAGKLAITSGDRTVFIRRLIYHNEQPVLLHREHVIYDPSRPIIEAEMEVTALRGLFSGGSKSGLKRGELAIDVTVLTAEEAILLQTSVGAPAFRLEHIFCDYDDRPVSWGWFICAGEHLRFTASIGVYE